MPDNDQTQDQKGQEQKGQDQTSQVDMNSILGRLDQLTNAMEEERKAKEKAEKEARQHQSARDRLQQQQQRRTIPSPSPRGAQQPTEAQERLRELEDIATDAAKENILLKETAKRGIPVEDVEGLEWDTPTELRLLLDNIQTKQELKALQKSLEEGGKKRDIESIDAGGTSGGEGNNDPLKKLDESYATARSRGHTQEARWMVLQNIHRDPRKLMRRKVSEE